MAPFLGLRGNRLNLVSLFGVLMPSIVSLGYNQSLLGGVLTLKAFEKQFQEISVVDAAPQDKSRTSAIQGTVVALYAIGGLFGALGCIGLGDVFGRRRIIMASSVIQLIGAILMTSAFTFEQLVISRIILGLGTGGLMATAPVWLSEISSTEKRGANVSSTGLFAGLGATIGLFVDFGMSFVPGSVGWRFPAAVPVVLSLIILGFISFLPESPRWLIRKDRVAEARVVLTALDEMSIGNGKIEAEIKEVKSSLQLAGGGSLGQIFRMGHQRAIHRTALAVMATMFMQLTGFNAITFYTNTIFETYLQLDSVKSRILAAIYQLVSLIAGTICVFTIEGLGRRGLLLSSATGNSICMALIAALGSQTGNPMAMHGAVVFIFVYHMMFVVGFGGVSFLYATEIAPLHLRATINGLAIATFWAFCVFIVEVTPVAIGSIQWRFFIIFAGLNALIVVLVYFLFPETSGRSLEEVDQIFLESSSIWGSVKVAKRLQVAHSTSSTSTASTASTSGNANVEDDPGGSKV